MKHEKLFEFAYHRHMEENGIARCINHYRGHVTYSYVRREHAGAQIGWNEYLNGERLPIHAVRGMEGDSYEALGRLRQRHQPHFQEAGV